jgi:hypothetical protein
MDDDEHVCSSSRNSICWATGCRGTCLTAWLAVSEMVAAVCVVAAALDAILEVVAVGDIGIGSCDVATAVGCSRRKMKGWGACLSAVGSPGSECRRF